MFPRRAPRSGLIASLLLAVSALCAGSRLEAQTLSPAGYGPVDVDSLTVSWNSTFNPGTVYQAALSSGPFPNSFTGNATSDTLNAFASFAGLRPDVAYYAAVATNPAGPYTDLGSATTRAAPPGFDASATFSGVTTVGLSVAWSSGTAAEGYNPAGATYRLDASVSPDFNPISASSQTTSLSFSAPSGLAPDTTYYVRVAAYNSASALGDYTFMGSTSTLAVAPVPAAQTFSGVTISALSVSWSSGDAGGYNGGGTVYTVQLSTKSDFSLLWASSQTAALTQAFAGLDGQKTYYARAQALNNSGGATGFASLGSTVTSTAAGLAASGFGVGSSSVTAAWFSAYPSGTSYYATVSTGPLPNAYSGNVSSVTLNLYAVLSGLLANATYYARASTAAAGPYTSLGVTSTLAAIPGYDAAVGSFTAVTTGGLFVHWSSGTPADGFNVAGTTYVAAIALDPGFQTFFATTMTTDTSFGSASGLAPDTTYYAAAAAMSNNGQQTAFENIGATSTLAVAPAAPPGDAFSGVSLSALAVSWASGTAAGYDGAGTRYVAQISTMAGFAPVWGSSQTAGLSASFSGLNPQQTYYARVQALHNSGGGTAFASLGSTVTTADAGLAPAGVYDIGSSSFTLAWTSAFAAGTTYRAIVSTGAFPNSFSGNVSSDTLNLFATPAGLTPNGTYYAEVSTAAAGPFTNFGWAVTKAAPPAPAGVPYTSVSTGGFTVNWTSGTAQSGYDPAGTLYVFQAATDAGFSSLIGNFETPALSLGANSGLSLDTFYYIRVAAIDNDGSQTAFTDFPATSTLAAQPAGPIGASTFTSVYSSSFTVQWSSGSTAAGGYNPAGALYYCQVSAASNFVPVAASSLTANLAATFTGLGANTTYYAQVQAVSRSGAGTAFLDLGSTTTLSTSGIDPSGFSAVSASALTVSWLSGLGPGITYYTVASSGPLPNTFSGNASSNTLNLSASFSGLSPASLYYLRLSTNSGAGPYTDLGSTATLAVPPAAAAGSTFTALSSSGLTLNWSSGTAAGGYDGAGTLYLARLSTAADFATLTASSQTANLFAAFSGLSGGATYYADARAANPAATATAFTDLGSAATPAAAPGAPASPFFAVAPSSVTLAWTSTDAAGTTYYAQVSPVSNFSSAVASSRTYATSAGFAGLSINATYYARVAAYDVVSGTWTAFTGLQSTITWAAIPASPAGSTFTAVSAQALTLHWSSGTAPGGYDPAGTLYLAQVSAAADYSSPASSRTFNLGADFAGLAPDTSYYARVEALNAALVESGFFGLGSTATPAALPGGPPSGASTFTALTAGGLTVNWSSGTSTGGYDPVDARYLVQLATAPGFGTLTASLQTTGGSAAFSGLSANAAYYARVAAVGRDGAATSFVVLGDTSTLAVAPSSPPGGSTFTLVFASSLTVSWSSGTDAGGYDPPDTLYAVELSTSPGFDAISASSSTYNLSAVLTGLDPLTTYYAQARAFNALSQPTAFFGLGSTETASDGLAPAGFSAVGSGGLTAAWLTVFGAGTQYTAEVSTGPLPNLFSGNQSSNTLNAFAAFTALEPNSTYYAQVSTSATGLYTSLGSTQTLAAVPAASASTFTAASPTGFTLN